MSLSQEEIMALLTKAAPKAKPSTAKPALKFTPRQAPNNVDGPLKYYEKEMRCASRGCSSPTHFKVSGIPYCDIHSLNELNLMLSKPLETINA